MEKNRKKTYPAMVAAKAIMLALTAVYPLVMVILSGAGLIYNSESYGSELTAVGTMLVISGVLLTAGAVFCLFRKTLPNIISLVCSVPGLVLCMTMLYKLADHADRAGWSDKFTMTPISDMYKARIFPSIAPAAIAIVIAAIQLFSYEAVEERRLRREKKLRDENASSPSILD